MLKNFCASSFRTLNIMSNQENENYVRDCNQSLTTCDAIVKDHRNSPRMSPANLVHSDDKVKTELSNDNNNESSRTLAIEEVSSNLLPDGFHDNLAITTSENVNCDPEIHEEICSSSTQNKKAIKTSETEDICKFEFETEEGKISARFLDSATPEIKNNNEPGTVVVNDKPLGHFQIAELKPTMIRIKEINDILPDDVYIECIDNSKFAKSSVVESNGIDPSYIGSANEPFSDGDTASKNGKSNLQKISDSKVTENSDKNTSELENYFDCCYPVTGIDFSIDISLLDVLLTHYKEKSKKFGQLFQHLLASSDHCVNYDMDVRSLFNSAHVNNVNKYKIPLKEAIQVIDTMDTNIEKASFSLSKLGNNLQVVVRDLLAASSMNTGTKFLRTSHKGKLYHNLVKVADNMVFFSSFSMGSPKGKSAKIKNLLASIYNPKLIFQIHLRLLFMPSKVIANLCLWHANLGMPSFQQLMEYLCLHPKFQLRNENGQILLELGCHNALYNLRRDKELWFLEKDKRLAAFVTTKDAIETLNSPPSDQGLMSAWFCMCI